MTRRDRSVSMYLAFYFTSQIYIKLRWSENTTTVSNDPQLSPPLCILPLKAMHYNKVKIKYLFTLLELNAYCLKTFYRLLIIFYRYGISQFILFLFKVHFQGIRTVQSYKTKKNIKHIYWIYMRRILWMDKFSSGFKVCHYYCHLNRKLFKMFKRFFIFFNWLDNCCAWYFFLIIMWNIKFQQKKRIFFLLYIKRIYSWMILILLCIKNVIKL